MCLLLLFPFVILHQSVFALLCFTSSSCLLYTLTLSVVLQGKFMSGIIHHLSIFHSGNSIISSCSMKAAEPQVIEETEPQSRHIDLEKLENARYLNEVALHKWQSLIVLENEAEAYRTIPLPYILSKEVQSLASLAESLILISTYCEREKDYIIAK